ncbi:MAG: hypothetical protein LBE25_13580 [Arthrobacter sp.]|jgi:hypothetical protein|nr:hypothetical protein [Arthrobacter sp.]
MKYEYRSTTTRERTINERARQARQRVERLRPAPSTTRPIFRDDRWTEAPAGQRVNITRLEQLAAGQP